MSVHLQFLGAFAGVTGSKTLLEVHGKKYLIDCGLFQGPSEVRQGNWQDFPVPAAEIEAIFLTHAHLDHIGYLPRLYNQGFRGPIYCSEGTLDLASIILMDSAFLEEELASYAKKTGYSHHSSPKPLFTTHDAEKVLKLLVAKKRAEWHEIQPGLSLRFLRAGHIIGASLVQIKAQGGDKSILLSFTGDLGHSRSLTLKEPELIRESDVLIMESTYGNRLHSREDCSSMVAAHLNRAFDRQGVVVIPAFAVGRSQELIYMIAQLEAQGLIPSVPVILDSPMSQKALKVFFNHEEDQSIASRFRGEHHQFYPKKFEISESADQSMLACMMDGPAVIISASGMLSGGRVLHHLKHRLPYPQNLVLFTGYQAEGTKGRFLQDNAQNLKTLRIHHAEVSLAAEVATIENLSSHADYQDMLQWLKNFQKPPQMTLVNHGNPEAQKAWALRIQEQLGWRAKAACEQQSWHFPFA